MTEKLTGIGEKKITAIHRDADSALHGEVTADITGPRHGHSIAHGVQGDV